MCYDCKSLENDKNEVEHDHFVRCPHCRVAFDPIGDEGYEFYHDGEHEIYCHECDKQFTFITHVSFSFESPALEGEKSD